MDCEEELEYELKEGISKFKVQRVDISSWDNGMVEGMVISKSPSIVYHVLVFHKYRNHLYIDEKQLKGLFFTRCGSMKIHFGNCKSLWMAKTSDFKGIFIAVALDLTELIQITTVLKEKGQKVYTKTHKNFKIDPSEVKTIGIWSALEEL